MVKVKFIEETGTRRDVDAKEGEPLMYAAKDAGIEGIIAECGGSAMCATCHCYVVEAPNGPLPAPDVAEADTIEFNAETPTEASRLTCQLVVTAALEGAVFQVATGR
ncbi:2Fe-2S iron-sulfur cluster-binding protein [Tropicibacter naphthalenivorans]|uniref:Ferredoxin VI n=1 Tax=Tropicibacter naphthalenivorans TaxID=441103 RepID=A0A0P1GH04_9RHOB|nr:2Fe-2S iron-sulfur cluster-binding protein [Tropicibacter naphthalenivorans]CUH80608.1 Ferredoxin VI [Tropicibacter naphthalenivorans]SMC89026.1 ferredoxin, 2Fe-2S [Tropicibacter naphthalenivorans]